jgi:hypothetical protein
MSSVPRVQILMSSFLDCDSVRSLSVAVNKAMSVSGFLFVVLLAGSNWAPCLRHVHENPVDFQRLCWWQGLMLGMISGVPHNHPHLAGL